ncbi:exonuclease SbcCD subunit D [Candidatus Woesearchaeota archaeon]|nr:exonuclease SbcCD subunit D [Candidatus Woesearchaeota archaeon]
MKYAHLADLHLGSWRDQKMRDLSTEAFLQAMDSCLQHQVDFILFAGDLFNTSLPSLDTLKIVTKKLKELKDQNIPVYVIAGSHDFSPSGKTMIDVLENAGLLQNVCRGTVNPAGQLQLNFTTDAKTGAKITGVLGRKGQLDRAYYENLSLDHLEQEPGYKIFMFHTTITELKPPHLEEVEAQPASFLPKKFNYYAGGHIHHPTKVELPGYGTLTYPGALFPNNFAEIEKYSYGGYYLVTAHQTNQELAWIPLQVRQHYPLTLNCTDKSPEMISLEILEQLDQYDLNNSLITIRLMGTITGGKISDIPFTNIFERLYHRGAYFVMKNTAQLYAEEFEEISSAYVSPEQVEEVIIKEHLQQIKLFDRETELLRTKELLGALNTTKREGETVTDFQQRVINDMDKILNHNEADK